MTTRRLREWCGGALLFVAYDFLWVGFAAALLLSGEDSLAFIAIGTACVVGASAANAARANLERRAMGTTLYGGAAGIFGGGVCGVWYRRRGQYHRS